MATDRRPAGSDVRHAQQFDNKIIMLIVNNTIKYLIIIYNVFNRIDI